MKSRRGRARSALLLIPVLAALCGTFPVLAADAAARDGLALYVALGKLAPGAGESGWSPRVLQAGLDGKVIASVDLWKDAPLDRRTGNALGFRRDGNAGDAKAPWCLLVATSGPDLRIVNARGEVNGVSLRRADPGPAAGRGGGISYIGLAVAPGTGDVLLADNSGDRLVLLSGWPPVEAVGGSRILGADDHLQDMHLAYAGNGTAIFSTGDPRGTYLIPRGARDPFAVRVLPEEGVVAGDPGSNRWAFASTWLPDLRVFAGEKRILKMEYPNGAVPAHPGNVAFGPGGILVLALSRKGNLEFVEVDLRRRAFSPLFTWTGAQMEAMQAGWTSNSSLCIAIGPRMPWGAAPAPPAAPDAGKPGPGGEPPR